MKGRQRKAEESNTCPLSVVAYGIFCFSAKMLFLFPVRVSSSCEDHRAEGVVRRRSAEVNER